MSRAHKKGFKNEIRRNINKDHLHDDVLSDQAFLDFDTYKAFMGLIGAHVSYLTQIKNEENLEHRIELLRKIKRDTSTFEESGSEIDS